MTATLDARSYDRQGPGPSLRLVVETGLYAVGTVLVGGLAFHTSLTLFQEGSLAWADGSWTGVQGMVLGFLILTLGLRIAFALFLATREHWRLHRRAPVDPPRWPKVSILVPAYNEEETIEAALCSTLSLDYPDFEIVFVDDGSDDRTLEIARRLAGRHGGVQLKVLGKQNGGKWSAHNLAFRHAEGAYVLCVDADSRLEPDALKHLVRALDADPKIGAVAGQVRVRNRDRALTCVQALEYLNCNGSMRTAQSGDGCVLVVPGPIGLFRRSACEEVWQRFGRRAEGQLADGELDGPYESDTFAEDFDLSLAVLQLGYRVSYEPRAISNTKAPETTLSLLNQRYRWQRGSLQVLRKVWRRSQDRPELLPPHVLKWILLAYGVDLVLIPVWLLLGLPFVVMSFLDGGVFANSLLSFLFLMFGANFLLALCYASTHRDSKWLAPLCAVQDFYNTFVLQVILLFVVVDEARGAPMRWS